MIRMSIKSGLMFIALGAGVVACKPAISGNLKSDDEFVGAEDIEPEPDYDQSDIENRSVNSADRESEDLKPIQDSCYRNTVSYADTCQDSLARAKSNRTYTDYLYDVVPYGSSQPSFIGPGVGYSAPHVGYTENDGRDRVSEQEYLNRCVNDAQRAYRCRFLACMIQNAPGSQRQLFRSEYASRQCRL